MGSVNRPKLLLDYSLEETIRSHRQRSRGEYDETKERSLSSVLLTLLCIVLVFALGSSVWTTVSKVSNPITRVLERANQTSQGQR